MASMIDRMAQYLREQGCLNSECERFAEGLVEVMYTPTSEMLQEAYDQVSASDNPLNALDCWQWMLSATGICSEK